MESKGNPATPQRSADALRRPCTLGCQAVDLGPTPDSCEVCIDRHAKPYASRHRGTVKEAFDGCTPLRQLHPMGGVRFGPTCRQSIRAVVCGATCGSPSTSLNAYPGGIEGVPSAAPPPHGLTPPAAQTRPPPPPQLLKSCGVVQTLRLMKNADGEPNGCGIVVMERVRGLNKVPTPDLCVPAPATGPAALAHPHPGWKRKGSCMGVERGGQVLCLTVVWSCGTISVPG